ncbi:hypothetical protein BRD01_07625 [Halobacteriales archaeon QS_8_65_32]|nr:MAG: hypothetical protein BRD01_07625 [Halobacteriales archaeon QS_8_65_32]
MKRVPVETRFVSRRIDRSRSKRVGAIETIVISVSLLDGEMKQCSRASDHRPQLFASVAKRRLVTRRRPVETGSGGTGKAWALTGAKHPLVRESELVRKARNVSRTTTGGASRTVFRTSSVRGLPKRSRWLFSRKLLN